MTAADGGFTSALLTSRDPRWSETLASIHHDVYHLPAYAEFASRWHEPGTPMAFVAIEGDHRFLVPLIVRPIPVTVTDGESWYDATGPRGYPGPVTGEIDAVDETFVARAIGSFIDTLRANRVVTAFVRCHPLLSPSRDVLGPSGAIVEHGQSVSIDLTQSADDVWVAMRENHRRAILRARADGYTVRIDDSWDRLAEFTAVYAATMDRLGAAARWHLPMDYFQSLRAALGRHLHLCVVEQAGHLAAAALLTERDGIVEYHLSGTAPTHRSASPTKILIEHASRWARERGNRAFHLAGSLRPDDPLIHFKRGFSRSTHAVLTWRLVTDPPVHDWLMDRWRHVALPSGLASADETFFPAYRRPAGDVP